MTAQSTNVSQEAIFDVSQLASVEIFSPKVDDSVSFFTKLLGMLEVGRNGRSVYLRAYEETYKYSLKITEHDQAGMGTCTLRTSSEQALQRRAKVLGESGIGDGWRGGDPGRGDSYRFHSPDGHDFELVWDVEYADISPEDRSPLLNRASKRPAHGIPVRRLDHVNLLCSNVTTNKDAFLDLLGFRLSERIVAGDGSEMAAWTRVTSLAHDVAFMRDATGTRGRLHHICYWYGYPQHLMDVADLFAEQDVVVEAGPGKHGISQANFLYCFEPGGNRVELFGDAGYLIFDPTWKPVTWTEAELARGIVWIGSSLPAELFRYGTPDVQVAADRIAAE